jgi:hypothetical protein
MDCLAELATKFIEPICIPSRRHVGKLNHFCGNPGLGVEKMERMTAYMKKHITG